MWVARTGHDRGARATHARQTLRYSAGSSLGVLSWLLQGPTLRSAEEGISTMRDTEVDRYCFDRSDPALNWLLGFSPFVN